MSAGQHKAVVRRLVSDVLNGGRLDLLDQLYDPSLAERARAWISPFLEDTYRRLRQLGLI